MKIFDWLILIDRFHKTCPNWCSMGRTSTWVKATNRTVVVISQPNHTSEVWCEACKPDIPMPIRGTSLASTRPSYSCSSTCASLDHSLQKITYDSNPFSWVYKMHPTAFTCSSLRISSIACSSTMTFCLSIECFSSCNI